MITSLDKQVERTLFNNQFHTAIYQPVSTKNILDQLPRNTLHIFASQAFKRHDSRQTVKKLRLKETFRCLPVHRRVALICLAKPKLTGRFNANSYLAVNETLMSHDVARGRGTLEEALSVTSCEWLVAAVDSDRLYLPRESDVLARPDAQVVLRELVRSGLGVGAAAMGLRPSQAVGGRWSRSE